MKNETPKKVGRKTKLDVDDEQNIVNYAEFMSDNGTPVTPKWLKETGSRMVALRLVFA